MFAILGRLSILNKLLLISFCFLLPIIVLLALVIKGINGDIRFAALEVLGNRYQRPLEQLLQAIGDYQIQATDRNRAQAEQAFNELEAIERQHGPALQFTEEGLKKRNRAHLRAALLRRKWDEITARSNNADDVSAAQLAGLIADIRGMITHAGDTSNLILDPDLDSYYLMDITLLALPQTQDRLIAVIRFGLGLAGQADIAPTDRVQAAVHATMLAEADLGRIAADVQTVLQEDPNFYGASETLQAQLPAAAAEYQQANQRLVEQLNAIANGTPPDRARFLEIGQAARQSSFTLWDVSERELTTLLETRMAHFRSQRTGSLTAAAVTLALSYLLVFFIIRNITHPLRLTVAFSGRLASGDFSANLPIARGDEIGAAAAALNRMTGTIRGFLRTLAGDVRSLADASAALSGTSETMTASIREMSDQISGAATAGRQLAEGMGAMSTSADRVSGAVHTVQAAISEMNATVAEVARNCEQEAGGAKKADAEARKSRELIARLEGAAHEIVKVIEVIDSIADQTNLLALNATIEAASAGAAGKGFAVVAGEVKELSRQSAKATGQIAQHIRNIQDSTRAAVAAIESISGVVAEFNQIAGSIAAAMEEQSATTSEIDRSSTGVAGDTTALARHAVESARSASEFSATVFGLRAKAELTSGGFAQTSARATELASMAARLKTALGQFVLE